MGTVIPFRTNAWVECEEQQIDLLTAVDAAIRDLRDISRHCEPSAREQADECRRMLEKVYSEAVER